MDLGTAIIAGGFSLLGAFAGSRLTRRNDYDKWLRESRSEVFSKFLDLLSEAQANATTAMFDECSDDLVKSINVIEAYRPASNYARVVSLYLPKDKRAEFKKLFNEACALHSNRDLGDSRLIKMTDKLDVIQSIFEECL